jgi:hypothetical protein
MPEAPRPNDYVNAFTPPPAPQPAPQMLSAFQPVMPATPYGMPGPMTAPMPMMNPYAPQALQANAWMNFYAQQAMMAGYANPYAANPYQAQSQRPLVQMNLPANYSGPQAPNPFAGASPYGATQVAYNPAMDRREAVQPAYQGGMVEQLAKVLREAQYPSQREWAAQSLAALDERLHSLVAPLLLQAATQDPAGSVRAGCVHYLARLSVAPQTYLPTLQTLRNDSDPRVRQEVEQAVARPGHAHVSSAPGSN